MVTDLFEAKPEKEEVLFLIYVIDLLKTYLALAYLSLLSCL